MRGKHILMGGLLLAGCNQDYAFSDSLALGAHNPLDMSNPVHTDRVLQASVPEVDVLWTVDNSCSMWDEQSALSSNFAAFMNYFLDSGLDYHIGVVSTDMVASTHKGQLQAANGSRWIEPDTANPMATFADMVLMGTGGSITEKGRMSTYAALELHTDGPNRDFQRDDATLHVVVVSDEEDDTTDSEITVMEFGEYLLGLKSSDDYVTFSSIVMPENCGGSCGDGEPGTEYLQLTDHVGGIEWDIRTSDWSDVLNALGMQAAGMRREIFLSRLPDPGTLQVWSEDRGDRTDWSGGSDWVYDEVRNSIFFVEDMPGARSEVFIKYEVLSSRVTVVE